MFIFSLTWAKKFLANRISIHYRKTREKLVFIWSCDRFDDAKWCLRPVLAEVNLTAWPFQLPQTDASVRERTIAKTVALDKKQTSDQVTEGLASSKRFAITAMLEKECVHLSCPLGTNRKSGLVQTRIFHFMNSSSTSGMALNSEREANNSWKRLTPLAPI